MFFATMKMQAKRMWWEYTTFSSWWKRVSFLRKWRIRWSTFVFSRDIEIISGALHLHRWPFPNTQVSSRLCSICRKDLRVYGVQILLWRFGVSEAHGKGAALQVSLYNFQPSLFHFFVLPAIKSRVKNLKLFVLLSSSTNITNCPAQLNRFLEEGSVQLLPTDQSYQVGSQNSITRTRLWKFGCCQNCYCWSCSSLCYSTPGELQEADDKRDQLGEGHLHVAAQRRQESCWCRLWKVSLVFFFFIFFLAHCAFASLKWGNAATSLWWKWKRPEAMFADTEH